MAIAALTTLDYPLLFPYSFGISPLGEVGLYMVVVAARNVLLLGVTLILLFRPAPMVSRTGETSVHQGDEGSREGEQGRESVIIGRRAVRYEIEQAQI